MNNGKCDESIRLGVDWIDKFIIFSFFFYFLAFVIKNEQTIVPQK